MVSVILAVSSSLCFLSISMVLYRSASLFLILRVRLSTVYPFSDVMFSIELHISNSFSSDFLIHPLVCSALLLF